MIKRGFIFGFVLFAGMLISAGEVKKVENGLEPSGKKVTFKLTEDLVVGPETGGDEYIWPAANSLVDADKEGNMFICDTGGNRVVELNNKGELVRTIGQQGNGPGEFQGLQRIRVLNDGRLAAFDFMQVTSNIQTFDKDGKYLDKKSHMSMEMILTQLMNISPDGQWMFGVATTINMAEKQMMNNFALLDMDFKMKHIVTGFDQALPDQSKMGDSNYWAEMIANNMKRASKGLVGFSAFDENGNIYFAKASDYEITKYNNNLEETLTFGRNYKPIPQTKEDIDAIVEPIQDSLSPQLQSIITTNTIKKAIELAEFPPVKNPIAGLKTTPEGYILVIHDASLRKDNAIAKVDIFDGGGHYVGRFEHPTRSFGGMVFKNGYAYTLETKDDENHLVRYKVEIK